MYIQYSNMFCSQTYFWQRLQNESFEVVPFVQLKRHNDEQKDEGQHQIKIQAAGSFQNKV